MASYPQYPQVVLASGSATRRSLLQKAGISHIVCPSNVDERVIKAQHAALDAAEMAMLLAAAKAREISLARPGDYVIGSDQMLDCDGVWLEKPETIQDVRATLTKINGRPHRLITAAVIMVGGQIVWAQVDVNLLTVRAMTDDEINAYVSQKGQGVLGCLGGFKIEESPDLFSKINGTIESIQGLPMAPLTEFLQKHVDGALA